MRACYVTFTTDFLTARDLARVLMAAPKDAVVHRISEQDFGRETLIALRSGYFADVPEGKPVPGVVATLYSEHAEGGERVEVPWPLDPDVA